MMMANNLNEMIAQSGMPKKDVAEAKGVTPETVSRHIHSKISMTLQDVDDYARILQCKPHEIAYSAPPIPILGAWVTDPDTKNMKLLNRFQTMGSQFHKKGLYIHGQFDKNLAAIYWDTEQNTKSHWRQYHNALTLIKIDSVADNKIDQNAIMNKCYVMTKAGVMLSGILWPQHHNALYTLTEVTGVSKENRILTDLDILWAAPVYLFLVQRRLHNIVMVDYESPFIAKHYNKLVINQTPERKAQYEKIYQVKMVAPIITGKTDGLKIVD